MDDRTSSAQKLETGGVVFRAYAPRVSARAARLKGKRARGLPVDIIFLGEVVGEIARAMPATFGSC
jgi:hypothetical protein